MIMFVAPLAFFWVGSSKHTGHIPWGDLLFLSLVFPGLFLEVMDGESARQEGLNIVCC